MKSKSMNNPVHFSALCVLVFVGAKAVTTSVGPVTREKEHFSEFGEASSWLLVEAHDPRGSWFTSDEFLIGSQDRIDIFTEKFWGTSVRHLKPHDIQRFVISTGRILPGCFAVHLKPENRLDWIFGGEVKKFYFRDPEMATTIEGYLSRYAPDVQVEIKNSIL